MPVGDTRAHLEGDQILLRSSLHYLPRPVEQDFTRLCARLGLRTELQAQPRKRSLAPYKRTLLGRATRPFREEAGHISLDAEARNGVGHGPARVDISHAILVEHNVPENEFQDDGAKQNKIWIRVNSALAINCAQNLEVLEKAIGHLDSALKSEFRLVILRVIRSHSATRRCIDLLSLSNVPRVTQAPLFPAAHPRKDVTRPPRNREIVHSSRRDAPKNGERPSLHRHSNLQFDSKRLLMKVEKLLAEHVPVAVTHRWHVRLDRRRVQNKAELVRKTLWQRIELVAKFPRKLWRRARRE